ncbi:hypothetical protein, partial [Butyrivibrio sp. ob235]|uniref:hypothetical protein n=1 Tax=Butyrivibrio sp. ob235 TaxID=1761780 RepID=UPI001A9A624A
FDKKIRLKYQSLCGIEGYDELRFMRLDCQTSGIWRRYRWKRSGYAGCEYACGSGWPCSKGNNKGLS